jgi:hypothetical protein
MSDEEEGESMVVSKVPKAALNRGTKVEHTEHPWTTIPQARRIATDHLKAHPGGYPAKRRK